MKPLRVVGWFCALGLWAAGGGALQAAWCNVFQVCCDSCGSRSSSSYYIAQAAPAASPCCPQPCPQTCTTHYEMRCYYQPVTTYQSRTYYEPVTTYKTSYYYEPVTSYRYSCYYDPCSCSYQQVACPVTCYQLKSQCCPVQSWVQRCCSVPVTSYQQSFYWQPVTTCCAPPPPPPCPPPCPQPCAQVSAPAPQPPANAYSPPPPVVNESQGPNRPPVVREQQGVQNPPEYNRYYAQPNSGQAPSYRQVQPYPNTVRPVNPVQPPPQVRLDRIVALPRVTYLEGQVVRDDNTPRANVRLRFVNLRGGPEYPAAANGAGRFQVSLASGSYLVYITTPDGRQVYHSRVDLPGSGTRQITLVSR